MAGTPAPRGDGGRARRRRLVALLVLGIGTVLLASASIWFVDQRTGVGAAQLSVGVLLLVVAAFLFGRGRPR
jgi:drug/metabolite transporter (DMT)-like permease